MANILYGNLVAQKLKDQMALDIATYEEKGYRKPSLAVVVVGDDPASRVYVNGKRKACEKIGMESTVIEFGQTISQDQVIKTIEQLNQDPSIDGILVQLPLPNTIDEKQVVQAIDPSKDVDGLHPLNVGKLYLDEDGFVPCTPLGIMHLLHEMNCPIEGKRAVVIGRSNLVGSPIARLLQNENATVTICHSKTENLQKICKEADILVVAMGNAKMINHDYVKDGAYVIDVGIHRLEDGLCGDVDFDDVVDHVSAITPVPKGVGPMTICMLLSNTMKSYKERVLK